MKKFLMIGSLCFVLMLFTSSAFADFPIEGTCKVKYIKLYQSGAVNFNTNLHSDDIPIKPCEVDVTFVMGTQTFELSGILATGTQINLAILKAFNEPEEVSCTLIVQSLDPLKIYIQDVDFPAKRSPI